MAKRSAFTDFDEFFMNAFQFQQSLNEKRETRMQDINFKLRELTLLEDYRADVEDRLSKSQGIRKDEGRERLYRSGFTDTPEGQTPDVNIYDQGLTSPIVEQKQSTTTGARVGADGFIHRWNPDKQEYFKTNLKAPVDGTGSGSGSTTTKDPKLTQSASDGLAFLKDPVFQKSLGGDLIDLTNDEVSNKFSRSINALKKDVLGARATNWFDNIVRKFGRMPTADELDKEILKHGEGRDFEATLTDAEVGQLNRLVEYLENAESGIKRIEERLKPVTEPEKGGGFLGREGLFGVKDFPIL